MDKDNKELKEFLEQQLIWSKNRDHILEKIEKKLHEMKGIAQYVLENELSSHEINELNTQLQHLKNEVHDLEKLLTSIVH